jgi:hypothetical protein
MRIAYMPDTHFGPYDGPVPSRDDVSQAIDQLHEAVRQVDRWREARQEKLDVRRRLRSIGSTSVPRTREEPPWGA